MKRASAYVLVIIAICALTLTLDSAECMDVGEGRYVCSQEAAGQ